MLTQAFVLFIVVLCMVFWIAFIYNAVMTLVGIVIKIFKEVFKDGE